MAVTFFADLGHFQNRIPGTKTGSYRQRAEINPFNHQVFPEGPILYAGPTVVKFLYLKKTDLTVPFSSVGVAFNSKIFQKTAFLYAVFLCSLATADTDRPNNPHRPFPLLLVHFSSSDRTHIV